MKKSLFRGGSQCFHLNIDFEVQPIFKELDWIFVQNAIRLSQKQNPVEVHAFVMMDTHVHVLISSIEKKENYFCEDLKSKLKSKGKNQAESHCEPILNYAQYLNAYKYIYRNPVEAGLVSFAESYLYSSLRTLLGHGASRFDIIDHLGLIQNPRHLLSWLNNTEGYRFSKVSEFNKPLISTV